MKTISVKKIHSIPFFTTFSKHIFFSKTLILISNYQMFLKFLFSTKDSYCIFASQAMLCWVFIAEVDRPNPKHLVKFYLYNFNVLFPVTLSSIDLGHNHKKQW